MTPAKKKMSKKNFDGSELEKQNAINQPIIDRFMKLSDSQRMAHAYLFIGSKGLGKFKSALTIAKLLNCENIKQGAEGGAPCGACPACGRIESGNHPDVFIIESEDGTTIKINKIRDLISRSQLRPFEANRKIFIIRDIENLTLESANALLKTLEEPTKDSMLLLTTSVPEKILSTVKSRCQAVLFFPLSKQKLADILEEGRVEKNEAHFLSFFSQGCLSAAYKLSEGRVFLRKNEIIDNIIFARNNESYTSFTKELLADKEETKQALDILFSWYRDLMLLKVGIQEQQLVNVDRKGDLQKLNAQYSFKQLKEIIDELVSTVKLLGENLNVKIPFSILREKIWVNL